jgi:hypothetical protein
MSDIKYVEARYHLAAAAESSILCYWLPGDTSYHHEALLTSLAQAAKHLGLELVPAATPTATKEAK